MGGHANAPAAAMVSAIPVRRPTSPTSPKARIGRGKVLTYVPETILYFGQYY
jgi:hypothetical protein